MDEITRTLQQLRAVLEGEILPGLAAGAPVWRAVRAERIARELIRLLPAPSKS
jgi:hypothetical protein